MFYMICTHFEYYFNKEVKHMKWFVIFQGAQHLADLVIPKKSNTEGKSNTEEKSNAEGSILDYSHHSSVKDFQLAISDVLRDDIVHGVKNSDCFSLMFDESTDVSVSQNLIIYIRYLSVDKVSARVEPTTSFLAIRALFRANAESITSEILDVLRERQIPLDKLIGVATDGAAVMTGKKSGVIQRLKEIQPDIVATHCIAHRLALSCGGAADKIPYLVKFQGLLNDIFKYFRNSGKNSASLKAIQSIVEQASKCKKFKEVFHTRWLSFDGALQALLQNYNSLVSLFLEESSGKALCLHKPITSYKFLYVAHYLADVMDHLSRLSKMYQRSDLDFTDVNPLLEATIETIRELKETKTGATLRKFVSSVPTTPTEDDDGLCTFQFGPHTVRDGVQQRKEALSACDSFTDLVIQNLKQRFTATDDATTLTSLTRLFNPAISGQQREWHEEGICLLETRWQYGRDEKLHAVCREEEREWPSDPPDNKRRSPVWSQAWGAVSEYSTGSKETPGLSGLNSGLWTGILTTKPNQNSHQKSHWYRQFGEPYDDINRRPWQEEIQLHQSIQQVGF